jgi:hypothetical protein
VTMHLVVGDGEMPKKALLATLGDLWDKAGEDEFWFTVFGKAEPTATDKALVEWMAENQIYYEVLTDADEDDLDDVYAGRQKLHTAKKVPTKAVNLLKGAEDGADVLALFVNVAEETEADAGLFDILQVAIDADFKAFGLNDSMNGIDLSDSPEEEEEAAKPAKAPAKKAAASKKAAPRAEKTGPRRYTREELEDTDTLTDAEVRAIGQSFGITTRGRDNWVNKILEKQGEAVAEEEEEEVAAAAVASDGAAEAIVNPVNSPIVIVMNPATGSLLLKPLTEDIAEAILGSAT